MATKPFSSSFSYRFTYDVFLSFRGEDTRYGFTGNLYKSLCDKGIHTFIDDQNLPRGDQITSALHKAIQESRIFIIVLSKNYASSSFCLDELDHILRFSEQKGLLVLPLFYRVDPSHVRHHTGAFGEALANHENEFRCGVEKLQTWKMALHHVANLSGYHFQHEAEYEYEFIQRIVKLVSQKIDRVPLHVADYPVGLEAQVIKVKSILEVGSDDAVHMVGIHGLGGVGKTTLAIAVYNSIADHFEDLCFLENVRDTSNKYGLEYLQSNILSETVEEIKITSVNKGISILQHRLKKKKVLLILDDVDKQEQLLALGRPHWFGPGSRVIVTTRNKQLLACHGVKRTYEVNGLNKEDALGLLSLKAFLLENVDPCYTDVLNRAVTYASGLPLALEVIGSNLCGRNIEQWNSTLDQYERIPNKEIQEILKVSFDALEEYEQCVFLDVACCYKSYELTSAEDILRAHHGHCVKHHIVVLVERSLIKISSDGPVNRVTLHDLIEDMGKEIVRKESPNEPGKRSRLWCPVDIVQVLEENKGTSQIEIICTDLFEEVEIEWDGDAFKKMENLKTLIIKNGNFSKGPKHLPNTLRVLEWQRYPSQNLPNDFYPKKLAICNLPNNRFTSHELAVFFKEKFVNVTSLNFDYCQSLTQIPDVSCVPHLEKLSFKECDNLFEIHSSVGFLENLRLLNAQGCVRLKSFPPIKLTSLMHLILRCCHSLESFPEILGKMENITNLDLQETPVKKFPLSFCNLTQLQTLTLCFPRNQKKGCSDILLSHICMKLEGTKLVKLKGVGWEGCVFSEEDNEGAEKVSSTTSPDVQDVNLKNCNLSDDFFPTVFPGFTNVKNLNLSMNNFTVIPECIKECLLLTDLNLNDCVHLREIRGIPPNLKHLSAIGCRSLTSSCRSMLLNQELHEAGGTFFNVPRTKIPEWFEFQTWELPISFWFRNKFPAMAICYAIERVAEFSSSVGWIYRPRITTRVIYNGHGNRPLYGTVRMESDCTVVLDMRKLINLDKGLIKNEWNHVRFQFGHDFTFAPTFIKTGIHVLKHESNNMEDIRFSDPCRETKLDDESQNQQLLKNQTRVEREVAKTQVVQQQQEPKGSFLSCMWHWALVFLISCLVFLISSHTSNQ